MIKIKTLIEITEEVSRDEFNREDLDLDFQKNVIERFAKLLFKQYFRA